MNLLTPPKLLIVSSSLRTGPLWAYTLQENKFDAILENEPSRTLRRWSEESPNLVLFDVNDPGTIILSIIRLLREESNVPVLLLTSTKPDEYILEAYDAGVDECIIKPISPSLFHAKIKAWLRRSWSVPMDVLDPLRVGNVHLVPAERKVTIGDGVPIHLTNLEMRLLYIMMNRPARTVAAEDLINRVWGYTGDADNTVLKNVIYRLRRKLEANQANPVIIHTVAGIGYRFEPEEATAAPTVPVQPVSKSTVSEEPEEATAAPAVPAEPVSNSSGLEEPEEAAPVATAPAEPASQSSVSEEPEEATAPAASAEPMSKNSSPEEPDESTIKDS